LPADLDDFSRQVRRRLTALEKQIGSARREGTRLLREASHALGRFEAEGEKRWRSLAAPARRRALRLLHRLERVLEAPKRKTVRGKGTRRRVATPAPAAEPAAPQSAGPA
jgi:hypothetical protein